jgi:hypothetical protein
MLWNMEVGGLLDASLRVDRERKEKTGAQSRETLANVNLKILHLRHCGSIRSRAHAGTTVSLCLVDVW